MSEFTPLREAVDTLVGRSPSPDFGELKRRATRRGRRRVAMAAAATAAVIAGSAVAVTGLDGDRRTGPVEQPKSVEGAGPVWYDANGLHRGDVVEQPPVDLGVPFEPGAGVFTNPVVTGGLALVRSGAVYRDPETTDVWFHPWGGEPRIVGRGSPGGPGGDPNGDTAAWFEGYDFTGENGVLGELVVYDTAAGREISRSSQAQVFGPPAAPRFLQVSADRVTWRWSALHTHDVRTASTSAVGGAPLFLEPLPADVHDGIEVYFDNYRGGSEGELILRVPGRAAQRFPNMDMAGWLSPSGNYLLAVPYTESDVRATVIIDTRTGEVWKVPAKVYQPGRSGTPQLAWSYGDIAMLPTTDGDSDTYGELIACDAAHRTCEPLPAEDKYLMPIT